MKIRHLFACLLAPLCGHAFAAPYVDSPDHRVRADLHMARDGSLRYSVFRDGKPVIRDGQLGLNLQGIDLEHALKIDTVTDAERIEDDYSMMVGKKRDIHVAANERRYTVSNVRGQKMDVALRVSADGAAFRYVVAEPATPHKLLLHEATSYPFERRTHAWLQPIAVAQTGWKNTNPSYEEYYQADIPVGRPSPSPAGWVFPALFHSGDTWVALTEANMDGSWQASRLQADSSGGVYRIGTPMPAEVLPDGALLAETDGALTSPWRIIALGSLATLTQSTLGTDLAAPAQSFDFALIKPGHASWSWALLKDDYTVFDVQKQFVDYAAEMHWDYTLVDADWDRKIGYDKIKELVDYAATKHIGILLWYNSSGSWNQTEYSPKSKLLTHEQRMAEFARLREIGIKGVKVDFFGGDGKSMIGYYLDILRDAADNGLLVNFHGATLPRGWQRTWPNLMTMEAVRGLEYTTFEQANEDAVVRHAAILPFARNLFDPMDFTPMVFGDIPNIRRTTSNGFELAESVLFLSGIQHFAETPTGMATTPEYVKNFLQTLPRNWDDSRLVAGYPGKYAVIARRAGDTWYVAGINAEEGAKTLKLDLSFLGSRQGELITDGATERSFAQTTLASGKAVTVKLEKHGGFVAVFQ